MINLKFELNDWCKTNVFKRWLARRAAMMIFKNNSTHYQFAGWNGSLKLQYSSVLASKFQLMHWILTAGGYCMCVADIMARCGVNSDDKKYE